jgi:hypothetical protein
MEPAIVKSTPVKPAKSAGMETAAMKASAMKAAEPAPAVEPAASAMRPRIGKIWLAERGEA